MRFVDAYHDDILRLITADVADESTVYFISIIAAGWVRNLGGAGFAADAVARLLELGVGVIDVVFQHGAHLSRRFGTNDIFTNHLRRSVYQMWLVVDTPINYC